MRSLKRIGVLLTSFIFIYTNFVSYMLINKIDFSASADFTPYNYVKIVAGETHTLAVKTDGSLWVWGGNNNGQIGDGTTIDRTNPKKVITSGVEKIAAGHSHSTVLKTDGTLWAWGYNQFGQVGDGSTTRRSSPVNINITEVKEIAAGSGHTIALKTDGSLWAWGSNSSSQIGDGSTNNVKIPKKIIPSGVVAIAAGGYHTLAVKADGSLWAWGSNYYGQLGDGTLNTVKTPKQIIASGVKSVIAGERNTVVIKTDNSVWIWGDNSSGQIGDGTMTNVYSPKILSVSDIKDIALGTVHTVILKTDGSLWVCGDNSGGQIGDGTTKYVTIPKKIIASGVVAIDAWFHTLILKNDGNIWSWGYNTYGQIGDGTMTNKLVPTKLVEPMIEKGKYAVVSNESVNKSMPEFTGSFSLEDFSLNNEITNLNLESFKKDFVKKIDSNNVNISKQNFNMQPSNVIYNVGDTKVFWTFNISTNSYVQINATLKSSGIKSNVWVNTLDYIMSNADADKITAEFDNHIFAKISTVFGQPSDMDSNAKVNILCYDIKDGFSGSGSYVAGYFDPNDLYTSNSYSNGMEIFYIDIYPSMGLTTTKDVTKCFGTIAHEFQHMVNWNQTIFIENNNPDTADMDLWLNEGLSEAASQVYSGQISQSRIDYYNLSSSITSGASLLKWNSTLENYSLSYLFMQYLKEQAGIGDSVFAEITQSVYNDYRSVEEIIKKYIDPNLSFVKFMTSFRAALLLKKPTGLYGFKGNAGFNSINPKIYSGYALNLYGGGAVVIAANSIGDIYIPNNKGATVNYFIIQDPPIITISPYQTSPTNQDILVSASTDVGSLNFKTHNFTENGSFDFTATNTTGDTTTKTVTITNIDKIAPIITVSDYPQQPTNQDVLVSAMVNEGALNFTSHTFTANSSFDFIAIDPAGNTSVQTVKITNIDKEAPIVSGVENNEIYNTCKKISFNEGEAILNNIGFVKDGFVKDNGNYTLKVTDSVGNSTTINFSIKLDIYMFENGTLTGISKKTNSLDFKNMFYLNLGKTIKVMNNSVETTESDNVGTGMTVMILDGNSVTNTYVVVIRGDVSGDGDIGIEDLIAVKQHLLKIKFLQGPFIEAGRIFKKPDISIGDLIALKKHLLDLQVISQ